LVELPGDSRIATPKRLQDLIREFNEIVAMIVASLKTLRSSNPKSKIQNLEPKITSIVTPLIELQNVTRQFGSQTILRDVSLRVRRGETLVIIGESGCGKSVTMKLMMDLLSPSAGEVLWDGRPIRERNDREIARERLRFGYVFQMAALFDSMTVLERVREEAGGAVGRDAEARRPGAGAGDESGGRAV